MVFRISFYFLFKNGRREQVNKNVFRRCYGKFFFESVIPKVLDRSYVQSSLSAVTRHLTTTFERHLTIEDFTDMDQHGSRHLTYYCILLFLPNKPTFGVRFWPQLN